MIGCLKLQPKIFGEVPIDFDFPCFDLNSDEIRVIEAPKQAEDQKDPQDTAASSSPEDSDETIGGFKVEDILNVVSKTADQGIKIIYDFFGTSDDEKEEPASADSISKTIPETSTNSTT